MNFGPVLRLAGGARGGIQRRACLPRQAMSGLGVAQAPADSGRNSSQPAACARALVSNQHKRQMTCVPRAVADGDQAGCHVRSGVRAQAWAAKGCHIRLRLSRMHCLIPPERRRHLSSIKERSGCQFPRRICSSACESIPQLLAVLSGVLSYRQPSTSRVPKANSNRYGVQ
jgi:hypothetical protein